MEFVCTIDGKCKGTVLFEESKSGTLITVNMKGLNQSSYQMVGGQNIGCIRIFDVDMNTGAVIPDSTTKHFNWLQNLCLSDSRINMIKQQKEFKGIY